MWLWRSLANSLATGAVLVALILALGPISADFSPAVTIADAMQGGIPWREVPAYVSSQILGAFVGVGAAHLMFGLPPFFFAHHARSGPAMLWSEFVATFGLVVVILGGARAPFSAVAFAVGAYITAAYWFTASTSFANPAVTLARAASDTFARNPAGRCSRIHPCPTVRCRGRDELLRSVGLAVSRRQAAGKAR